MVPRSALHALGNVYIQQSRMEDAFRIHVETLSIRLEKLGSSERTAASYHKLAWHHAQRGEHTIAE